MIRLNVTKESTNCTEGQHLFNPRYIAIVSPPVTGEWANDKCSIYVPEYGWVEVAESFESIAAQIDAAALTEKREE